MALEKLFLLATLFVSTSVSAATQIAGFIEVRPDGTRTLFTTERVSRDDQVLAQYADQTSQGPKCCVSLQVAGKRNSRAKVFDELNGRAVRAFALPPLREAEAVPYVGAALVFRAGERIPLGFDRASPQDAMDRAFPQACTSREGMHLLQLDQGKPRLHLYMHFGYEVEPTCSAELLKQFY